jgi:prepilin-type N-terminal cleavage/methylation domain-containing protein
MKRKGFTLIELLVVIAIIAILSVVVILTLNPAELLKQSRDSNRISDLSTTKTAILFYLDTATTPNLASSSFGYTACYLSTLTGVGTTSSKCGVFAGSGLTTDASTTLANYRNVNSTGWIPINFSGLVGGTPFGTLPVDPTNNASYYYSYAASSTSLVFEVDALMESAKYGSGGSNNVVNTDGGDNPNVYEVGSNLSL